MSTTFAFIRFGLRFGWLLPVVWGLSGHLDGRVGPFFPIYVFLGFGLLTLALDRPLLTWASANKARHIGAIISVCLVAGGVTLVSAHLWTKNPGFGNMTVDWILMCVTVIAVAYIVDWDFSYQSVLGDFRLGVFAIVFVASAAFATGHGSHLSEVTAFAGILGYAVFGLLAVSLARRYSPDLWSRDVRGRGFDSHWLSASLIQLVIISIGCLVLVQILGHDILGAIGNGLHPALKPVAQGVAFTGSRIVSFVEWLLNMLHLKAIHPKSGRQRTGTPQTTGPTPTKRLHRGKHPPSWFTSLLEVVGVGAIVALVLWGLSKAYRQLSPRRRAYVAADSTAAWSWRKFGSWLLGKTRCALDDYSATHRIPRLQRRSLRSVRDVYRVLLSEGAAQGRARQGAETCGEYGQALSERWPAGVPALQPLDRLYAEERYGLTAPTGERVHAALDHLKRVKSIMRDQANEPQGAD